MGFCEVGNAQVLQGSTTGRTSECGIVCVTRSHGAANTAGHQDGQCAREVRRIVQQVPPLLHAQNNTVQCTMSMHTYEQR
jgi:hypothetical protein